MAHEDPLSWFGGLGPRDKVGFVRSVFRAAEDTDPGFAASLGVWRRGKTVRFEAEVRAGTSVRRLKVHIAVDGGERDLLALAARRLNADRVEFGAGRIGARPGVSADCWLASLGTGTLAVASERGELMVVLNRRTVVPAAGTAVGSPSPFDGLPEDGWMAYLIDGQMHVVASVRDPTPREVAAARSAPVRMGLARPGRHLMVLGIEIAGFRDGWGEMPFALGLVEPERRRLLPPEMGGHGYVVMVLVDASTGLVEAFRPLRLPPAWTRRMHEIAEAQQDALSDFSPAAHDREVALFRALWPDTRALAAAFDTIAEAVDPGPTAR